MLNEGQLPQNLRKESKTDRDPRLMVDHSLCMRGISVQFRWIPSVYIYD